MSILLQLDEQQRVLYARRQGVRVATAEESPNDGALILSYDPTGAVVGVQILDPQDLPTDQWHLHPDRNALPGDILEVLDQWWAATLGYPR